MKHIIIITVLAASSTVHATTHIIKRTADNGPHTLRAAIAAAEAGDLIKFAPWLYGKTIRLENEIVINKNLKINGDIDGDRRPDIILDGQNKHRILEISANTTVLLWAIALENGSATQGGAIYNSGQITAHYCQFTNNYASDNGGAIYNRGQVTINYSTVANNTAQRGGAIFNNKTLISENVKTKLEASTFTMNRAYAQGGVVYNYHGIFSAYRSTFTDNLAHDYHDWSYSTDAKGSVLYQFGGGSLGGSAEFWDSTLKNNRSAPLRDPELRECDFGERKSDCSNKPDADRRRNNKNRRVNNGGTIYNRGVTTNRSNIKLIRTVIAKSTGRNCGGWGWFDLDHAWSDDNTCDGDVDYDGPGVSRGDAKLGALADNGGYTLTHAPQTDSELIDAGGSTCAAADQRDAGRKSARNQYCDIGSVEIDAFAALTAMPHAINTTVPDEHNEDPVTLHQIINNKNADIAAKTDIITAQQKGIEAKEETIANQQADIDAKTETITTLETQLQILNDELADVQQQIARKNGDMKQMRARAAELERLIANHRARIAELTAPDALEITMGNAGEITHLTLRGWNTLKKSENRVNVAGETLYLRNTVTDPAQNRPDGSIVSDGQFEGKNSVIYWTATSVVVPHTNFHVTRWEFRSNAAFGDIKISLYTDLEIGEYPGRNGLIVGGDGHPNRLLITDSINPTEGIALGLRSLKNASRMGWVGSPDIYDGHNGDILDPSILTGAYSGWGQFTPDSNKYPGSRGYGPADIAVAVGVQLKPSAKLAIFETTIIGTPTGTID
ncbi:choice-of-anchor Q domain-containing protein [Thiolapillus sp.]|uniref:choice-of-anchor Q domain-containing protein n=4 Tax=Thiolapillus sp. TaxID=2017437 RepID=UPI003AF5658E